MASDQPKFLKRIIMPKVSVIVPVYGVEKYIERCTRSLFEQTLDDIEYLFIDDCTPDKSIEILKWVLDEYPLRKQQVIIHRMEQNSGQAAVRKWGILNATGDYIIHCDSDDWVDVTMYEKLYNKAIEEDADMVVCDWYRSNGISHCVESQFNEIREKTNFLKKLISGRVHGSVWNKLIHARIAKREDIVYPQHNMLEDLVLTLQYIHVSNRFAFVKEPLYYYYQNPQSIVRSVGLEAAEKRFLQRQANMRLILAYMQQWEDYGEYKNEVMALKQYSRCDLEPFLYRQSVFKQWSRTFSEINVAILTHHNFSLYYKIRYLLCWFKIYPLLVRVKNM